MKLAALGIVVQDMGKALDFYRLLGLPIAPGAESEGHVELTLENGLRLMFDTIEVVRSFTTWEPPAGGHRMGLAFECVDAADVDAVYARLLDAGVQGLKPPFDAFWGQRYAQVLDPDGNPVDLFA